MGRGEETLQEERNCSRVREGRGYSADKTIVTALMHFVRFRRGSDEIQTTPSKETSNINTSWLCLRTSNKKKVMY
jgi:hypothetical protein